LGADKETHQNAWTTNNANGTPAKNMVDGVSNTEFIAIPQGHLIQAAFNLTAVSGLNLDFGFGIPIAYTVGANNTVFYNRRGTWEYNWVAGTYVRTAGNPTFTVKDDYKDANDSTTYQAPLNLSLGAEYKTGDLGVWFRTDFFFGGYIQRSDDKQYYPVAWDLHVKPYYKVGDIGTFGLDFGFDAYGNVTVLDGSRGNYVGLNGTGSGDDETLKGGVQTIGFGLWYQKVIAGGTFTTGLAYKLTNKVDSFYGEYQGKNASGDYNGLSDFQMKELGIFSIPVIFELSF
jgi:hypothetical protein